MAMNKKLMFVALGYLLLLAALGLALDASAVQKRRDPGEKYERPGAEMRNPARLE
jgi:hypothetical protein